jgi:hypothetical protein
MSGKRHRQDGWRWGVFVNVHETVADVTLPELAAALSMENGIEVYLQFLSRGLINRSFSF